MARRTVSLIVAMAALVVLSPLLAVISAAIVVGMGRPVLFRQRRSGLEGREFWICKFRTMRPPRYPGETDRERTTRLGTLLRTYSLDELPQLWNVLRGEMDIIGPRPTLPEQVARYGAHERRRLRVRPGLTGYAATKGRNSLSWPERIDLDIWYIEHRNIWLDLRVIGWTILGLLRPRGITGEGGVNPDFPAPEPAPSESARRQRFYGQDSSRMREESWP